MSWLSRVLGDRKPAAEAKPPVDPAVASMNLNCSFCGKHQREVRKLIAGPQVYICDECLGLSVDILDEEEPKFPFSAQTLLRQVALLDRRTPHVQIRPRLRAAIELANGSREALRQVVAVANEFADYPIVLAAIAAIPEDERSAGDRLTEIAILLNAGRSADALAALDRLDENTFDNVDRILYRLHRAFAELEAADVPRVRAAVHRKTALELAPEVAALPADWMTEAIQGERLAVLTMALLVLGEHEEAELAARERIVRHPLNADAHLMLARVLSARGDSAGADAARAEALEHAHPDGPLAQRLRSTSPFR